MLFSTLLVLSPAFANPIVNGEREDGFDSVVSLGAEFNGNAFSACSGNLITSRVVLSAAHCGADLPANLLVDMGRVFFGEKVEEYDHIMEIESMSVHPDYVPLESGTGNQGEFDMGILVLTEDAPYRPTPLRIEQWSREELPADVISVGYGITSATSQRGGGVKRSAELTVDDLDRMFLFSDSDTNPNEGQICSGDSGGPQFQMIDGRWHQVAVHSWGDVSCEVTSGSTRVDKLEEWIFDHIEDAHGTRDWCEAAGIYDDGQCDDFCDDIDPDCIEDTGLEEGSRALGCGCSQAPSPGTPLGWLIAVAGLTQLRRRRNR